jgi:hypothetical protein
VYKKYRPDLTCVAELGCFDARSLDWLPVVNNYHGYDAGWEGGLEIAKKNYSEFSNFKFYNCQSPIDFLNFSENINLFISLETLEHIPPHSLEEYILKICQAKPDWIFISVPNEKGLIFFLKHLIKIFMGSPNNYSFKEFVAATFSRLDYVSRDEHKGFDWATIYKRIEQDFTSIETVGIPFSSLPLWLNFQIGMVFMKKNIS